MHKKPSIPPVSHFTILFYDSAAAEKLENLLLYCFIVCARPEYRLYSVHIHTDAPLSCEHEKQRL